MAHLSYRPKLQLSEYNGDATPSLPPNILILIKFEFDVSNDWVKIAKLEPGGYATSYSEKAAMPRQSIPWEFTKLNTKGTGAWFRY